MDIEGDLTITGDADIVSTSGSYGGVVNLQGNTIDFRATAGDLTFGTITASGDALTDTNHLYSAGDLSFTDTVATAGDSNLVIRGEFVEQVASAVITTNELTLESAVSIDNSAYLLDAAPNNVNKLSSNTSNHLVGAIVFKDADALELGAINTDAVFVTADTFILTGATNLTIASNSRLNGAINQTATDTNNPAQINHNGGTLILDSASAYAFTGAFRYTAVSGATTQISHAQVLIDTPDHTQTFGTLNFFFDAFTVAAGSTVNVLNKANFNFLGTSLEGAGTIVGDVDIRNGATLNPGTDGASGIITINGNLKLFTSSNENSNFAPFIDNDTSFDAVTVMGTVELADVDFEPTGSFVITDEDQEMVLINNDGTDAVIGTFMGHPEGSIVNIGGYASRISYVGGDGNDVVLKAFTIDPATSFTTVWRTDNPGASDDNTITIPTFAGETYDYYVDWGDGTAVQAFNTDTSPSHTYETVGEVTVRIAGTFPRIYFSFQNSNNGGDSQKIIDVAQWGDIQWTSMEDAFRGCYNLDVTAPDAPDLSGVTSMRYAFYRCFALTGTAAFSSWDVSNVEDFEAMFISAEPFNIDISGWTVTSATSMISMFTGALAFNQPIGSWDVSSVTNMEGMFSNAQAFNQDLSGWNTANVISMANMFTAAKAFNGNITGWDTSSVERMHAMFFRAEAFDQDIGGWDVSKVTWMNAMFAGAISFDQDIGDWDISSLESDRAGNMFSSVTLSTANYDALLMGWSTLDTSTGETHIPTNLNFLGGSSQYCLGAAARQELIDTYNWTITDGGLSCSGILVSPKVYLNGASLNPNSGQESWMRDDLRVASLLPINSPYGDLSADANAFSEVEPNNNIVDWVWVELRDAADDTNIIAGRSALLQRDGDVVDVDGSAPVRFESVSSGNYYVVIKHRNHVGIMSSTAVSLSGTETGVDLSSDPSVVQGGSSAVVLLANGRYGMYTGDYDANAQIQNTDAYVVVQLIGGSGYEDGDMDLNTQIQNTDVNVLISPNIGRGEQFGRPSVPTEQLSTDVTLAFANAQITNDGVDDYYEADIVISGTTDFYVGSGQVYLDYATAAFGENISANGNIEYSQPDGSILGYSFGA
ncbi:MAG: BspA family leucine-rich repeat surface protein, partial [Cyanobacteria bacterium J06638_20]